MARPGITRYTDVAIGLHWLIAILIIGLVIVGKYMTGLDNDDPLRFVLTQWHKSFGITVLLLSVVRLIWRSVNTPPPAPRGRARAQHRAAGIVHGLLYLCLFLVPITGWILVSVSPLNIKTLLFDVIPWPHLEPFASYRNKEFLVHRYADYHELAGNVLIVLMLGHIAAALKHQFINKDRIMRRMTSSPQFAKRGLLVAGLGFIALLAAQAISSQSSAVPLQAGASSVEFEALVTGDPSKGSFGASKVTAILDSDNPANSSIVAIVSTVGTTSDNPQVQSSLPGSEWFDVDNYREALFESTAIVAEESGDFSVTGNLTIKGVLTTVSFPMAIVDEDGQRFATGEFSIDRRDYDIGMQSQATDDYVGFDVVIRFRFELSSGDA